MITKQKLWLVGITTLACFTLVSPANSQIVPDRTTKTKIGHDCLNTCNITGGILAGDNLFHSFQQFNVGVGESVYFQAPNVANIFSRITGNHPSLISGKLGVSGGDANLFLLNPKGIIFGAGARLDVNGSFVATTANAIQFGDRGFFAATTDRRENLALLTVNPSAFFFNQMGQLQPITSQPGAELKVPKQKHITLLAGQSREDSQGIVLRGTSLQAPEGRVTLGVVKEDNIVGIGPNFKLQFADDFIQGDIALIQSSEIDLSGEVSGSVDLRGGKIDVAQNSIIVANTLGDNDAGNIIIQTDNLFLKDNSFIPSSTSSMDNGGSISITTNSSSISASSSLGVEKGSIKINLDRIISSTLIHRPHWSPIPATLISADQIVAQKCSHRNRKGLFSDVARDGLTSNLLGENFSNDETIPDFNIPQVRSHLAEFFQPETSNWDFSLAKTIFSEELIEAQTWLRNKTGNIVLTAQSDRHNAPVNLNYCLFNSYSNFNF